MEITHDFIVIKEGNDILYMHKDIFKLLQSGKKIRKSSWDEKYYIQMDDNKILTQSDESVFTLHLNHFKHPEEWVEIEDCYYAFLKYDLFPYCVWRKVKCVDIRANTVHFKGGGIVTLSNCKLYTKEEGDQLIEEIQYQANRRDYIMKETAAAVKNLLKWGN